MFSLCGPLQQQHCASLVRAFAEPERCAVFILIVYFVFLLFMAIVCRVETKSSRNYRKFCFLRHRSRGLFLCLRRWCCFHFRSYKMLEVLHVCILNSFSPFHASFMRDSHWSACSVTCGEGIRTKQYRCKIFLELSQTLATLHNDSFCFGPKPAPQVERCILEPCSMAYGYEESYPR